MALLETQDASTKLGNRFLPFANSIRTSKLSDWQILVAKKEKGIGENRLTRLIGPRAKAQRSEYTRELPGDIKER